MLEIPLTQGKLCFIDECDNEKIFIYKWYFLKVGYAVTRPWDKETKSYKTIYMHRYLLNAKKGQIVDHINGNTLDNRKENLRICNHKENIRNGKTRSNNTSGYKGVIWSKQKNKWIAVITCDYKLRHLGTFINKLDAVKAYKLAAKKYFGEFASNEDKK